jgi:hypothetical protein
MCVAVIAACGLGDLLSEPRVADVVLAYTGPTTLRIGDTIPVAVTVEVDGTPEPGVRIDVTSSDSSIVAVLPSGDWIAARDRGVATLAIRFASAIFTDAVPTIVQDVRVNSISLPAPPPPPPVLP